MTENSPAVGAPVQPSVRPDVERVMRAVWDLVRSGPNFDGRQHNVEAAIAAAIDRAVAAERERWQRVVYARRVTPASQRDLDFNAGIDAAWAAVNRGLLYEA